MPALTQQNNDNSMVPCLALLCCGMLRQAMPPRAELYYAVLCCALQMAFLSLLSLVQSLVVWLGLAAGLVFCVWGSSRGRVSVGDTVLFISMMQQLYVPLTFFGSYYRQVRPSAARWQPGQHVERQHRYTRGCL